MVVKSLTDSGKEDLKKIQENVIPQSSYLDE